MCPACMSTLVLIAAGAGSTGGLTALIVNKLRGKHGPRDLNDIESNQGTARASMPEQKEQPR